VSPAEIATLRGLYAARPADLVHQLPEIADRIHSQLHELQRAPTSERAERLAIELEGIRRLILRVRESLIEPEGGRASA
jgi:hypothetical protein